MGFQTDGGNMPETSNKFRYVVLLYGSPLVSDLRDSARMFCHICLGRYLQRRSRLSGASFLKSRARTGAGQDAASLRDVYLVLSAIEEIDCLSASSRIVTFS